MGVLSAMKEKNEKKAKLLYLWKNIIIIVDLCGL